MSTKRPRDNDPDIPHYERSIKRRRVNPSIVRAALSHRGEIKTENVSSNFTPCTINTDDIKARVKYHVKRIQKFNQNNPERKSNETPAISVSELEKMCERAMKEKEKEVRMDYENALSCRMVEMYESFLKFNNDMMTNGPWGEVASYVS